MRFGATAMQKRRGGEVRMTGAWDILANYMAVLQNDSFAHPEAEHPFLMHTSYEHEERMLSFALAKLRSLRHHRDDFRDHANPMHLHLDNSIQSSSGRSFLDPLVGGESRRMI